MAIHRAIYGSLERFIGILVEHFAGAFPFWSRPCRRSWSRSPTGTPTPARELAAVLRERGLRVEVDDSANRMQNKIRLAQEQKVPVHAGAGRPRGRGTHGGPADALGEQQPAEGWEALADDWRRRRGPDGLAKIRAVRPWLTQAEADGRGNQGDRRVAGQTGQAR